MAEQSTEVKTYLVDYICDKCKVGSLKPTGKLILTSAPPQYPHVCDNCGEVFNLLNVYPRVSYERL